MPNGDEKNWGRFCSTIDGFRRLHGHWPTRIRICEGCFADLVGHVLKPEGFVLVSSVVEILLDCNLQYGMIAESADGAKYRYGESVEDESVEPGTAEFFGHAIIRDYLDNGMRYVALWDAKGTPISKDDAKMGKKTSRIKKKIGSKKSVTARGKVRR